MEDKFSALLTVKGHNRPGIVAEVTRLVYEGNFNITDSTMTTLGHDFVMMLHIESSDLPTFAKLTEALKTLDPDLHSWLDTPENMGQPVQRPQATHTLSVLGPDHTGIVYHLSQFLSTFGVNITDLNTQLIQTHETLYAMIVEVDLGQQSDLQSFQSDLQRLAQDLAVEIDLHPIAFAEL